MPNNPNKKLITLEVFDKFLVLKYCPGQKESQKKILNTVFDGLRNVQKFGFAFI